MNRRSSIVIICCIIFLFPLSYLFYKGNKGQSFEKQKETVQLERSDLSVLENAVKSNPDFDDLLNLSIGYLNNQMPGSSIEYLEKAIVKDPQSAIAYNYLGVAYIRLQQYQKGIEAFTMALQIDPSFQLAKNNLKWGVDEKNKVLGMIALQEQIPENKRNAEMELARGLNYLKIGDYYKSIEIWNEIAEADMKNTQALNNIGIAFMMKHQYDDAIVLFKKVLEIKPDDELAKNNLEWAMEKKIATDSQIKN